MTTEPVKKPKLWILAGPNGAGKTTFAHAYFSNEISHRTFLNADEIARGLSPGNVERSAIAAGRLLIERRAAFIGKRTSFVVETTLATRTLLQTVTHAQRAGYLVHLLYLLIADPEVCIQRVARRVAMGGHHIPSNVVLRRYHLSLQLLPEYVTACDLVDVYAADRQPEPVLQKRFSQLMVHDELLWQRVLKFAGRGG